MFLKRARFIAPAMLSALLVAACGGGAGFSRQIAQPETVVEQALADLDILQLPHTKAKLRAGGGGAGGGALPEIRAERTEDGLNWFVMSGGKAVLVMTASLEPGADGASTTVSTYVKAGEASDAPDVAPLFRSISEMGALFAVAVERELGDYIPRSERTLLSLQERPYGSSAEMAQAIGGRMNEVGQIASQLPALEARARQEAALARQMEGAESHAGASAPSFEPGKPMVDVSR